MMKRYVSALMFGTLLAIAVGTFAQAPAAPIMLMASNGGISGSGGGAGDGIPTITGISGSTSDEGALTIHGNDFLTHADYGGANPFLNVAWNDFDDALEGGGWVQDGQDPENTNRSTSSPKGGAIIAHYRKTHVTANQGSLEVNVGSNYTGMYYLSTQYRESDNDPVMGASACTKFIRHYVSADSEPGAYNWYFGPGVNMENATNFVTPPASLNRWYPDPNPFLPQNTWRFLEVEEYTGVSGIGDGTDNWGSADFLTVRLNNQEQMRRGSELPSNPQPDQGTDANDNHQWTGDPMEGQVGGDIKLGSHLCESGAGYFMDFAEAYLDYTPARVAVCHESTYAACSDAIYMQPPTAWSDTEITVIANRGTFADLPGEYLYVINENNEVNPNGFLINSVLPFFRLRRRRSANDDHFDQRMAA